MSTQLFLRSLRERRNLRGNVLQRAVATLKYVLRSVGNAGRQAAWLDFVYGTAQMSALLTHDARLIERAQHCYINRHMKPAERYAAITDHYRMAISTFPADIFKAIYQDGRYLIGTLRLKDGSSLAIEMRRPTGRSREGELCLCLADVQGQMLSSMIFSVADGGRTLLLGCMQGSAAGLGREAVRDLTKQSHGLRPKNLLLSLLRAFARHHGIERLRGVANEAHPFAGQADKIKADYDSFWLECEGVLDHQGFYELPAHEPARNEAMVASKHRSAFRQREVLRREGCTLLLAGLDQREGLALTG